MVNLRWAGKGHLLVSEWCPLVDVRAHEFNYTPAGILRLPCPPPALASLEEGVSGRSQDINKANEHSSVPRGTGTILLHLSRGLHYKLMSV